MDKLFIVLVGKHGYTPTIYGVYDDKILADKRANEVMEGNEDANHFVIIEVDINAPIELDI